MSTSILTSVKKGCGGIIESDHSFDPELIVYINTVLSQLTQIGVGPKAGFQISDETTTWEQFVGDDPRLNMVQSYVILSVRLLFDPRTVGAVMEAIKSQIAEFQWRLNVQAESELEVGENQNGNT